MSYIKLLREKVGNDPVIAVGATVIIERDDKILLNLRTDFKRWGLPGGVLEMNETMEDCAKREVFEETNLILKSMELLGVYSGPEYFAVYPNGDQLHTVIVLYKALETEGELHINDDESSELAFFGLDDLPELEHRAALILDEYKELKEKKYD